MPRRTPAETLARRLVVAAVEITADNPMRYAGIDALIKRLAIPRDESAVAALAFAIDKGWLKVNSGAHKHTVSVGPTWRLERDKARPRR